MQSFYILIGDEQNGPFDLASMVKRIKNGKLLAHDMILEEGAAAPINANQVPVFHEYFMEMEYSAEAAAPHPNPRPNEQLNLWALLIDGWREFEANQQSALVVSGGIIATLLLGLIVSSLASGAVAAIACGALLGALLHAQALLSALSEQQNPSWINARQMLAAPTMRGLLAIGALGGALCLGLPLALWQQIGFASILLIYLGYLLFSSLLFAPLIWLNNTSLGALSCSKASAVFLYRLSPKNLSKAIIIQSINFISTAILIFPLVLALPVTGFAWNSLFRSTNT